MSTAITRSGSGFTLAPTNWTELMQFADLAARSDMVPKDYKGKPANVALAVQMGGELGLSPMQSLQNIAVVNGRPSVWGDAMLALCQAHESFEDIIEVDDGRTATCTVKRRGRSPVVRTFSVEDVQRAGLGGVHKQYPARMRQMRARGFALRDCFADVLKGLQSAEESQDIPQPREVRADVVEAPKAEPPKQLAAEPPPAEGPRFGAKWEKDWAGRLIETAPPDVIASYLEDLDDVLRDPARSAAHAKVSAHKAEVEAVYERMVEREMAAAEQRHKSTPPPAADDIADRLQAGIDEREQQNTSAGWGLEAT